MKRLGAIFCLIIFALSMSMTVALAAGTGLKVKEVYPKDGAEDMAMDNMGFKVYFNEEVYDNKKNNAKMCHIIDSKGKEVPSIAVCNPKEKSVMMVLADTNNKKTKIKGKSKYTLKIDEGFKADNNQVLDAEFTSSFKTLNPSTSMWVSMGMMGVMVVAMVFFTTKEMKKQNEKQPAQGKTKAREKTVNPYKEAKRTGKSVEEIVAAEEKKKAKRKAKQERQKKENKVEIASDNIKVAKKRPISAVGIKYKDPAPKEPPKKQNNKNQGNKNKGGNKKKKK